MKLQLKIADKRFYELINSEEEIVKIVSDMHLTEGALWDYKNDRLIFNDIPVSNTMCWMKKKEHKFFFITERKQMANALIRREISLCANMRQVC